MQSVSARPNIVEKELIVLFNISDKGRLRIEYVFELVQSHDMVCGLRQVSNPFLYRP